VGVGLGVGVEIGVHVPAPRKAERGRRGGWCVQVEEGQLLESAYESHPFRKVQWPAPKQLEFNLASLASQTYKTTS
jgi:hypothetical protein